MNYKLLSLQTYSFCLLLFTICSCNDAKRPPESVVVEAPKSVTNKVSFDEPVLFIRLKENSISYKYDTTSDDKGLKEIIPQTSSAIKEALDEVEKKYGIVLSEMEDRVLIKGSPEMEYPIFRSMKEALKQKRIYKFRIVTVDDKPSPTGNNNLTTPRKEKEEVPSGIKPEATVTLLLSGDNEVYYYTGNFNRIITKTSYNDIGKLLKQYIKQIPANDLMFMIKSDQTASFKNAVDMLDEMVMNRVPPGHYAELEITTEEQETINNYKTRK